MQCKMELYHVKLCHVIICRLMLCSSIKAGVSLISGMEHGLEYGMEWNSKMFHN